MTHKVMKGGLLALAGLVALAAPSAARAGLEPINLAMTGAAYQSSQPSYYANPYMAIDGVDGGDPNNYGATLTDADWHSWWEVDLQEVKHIGTIEIINRTDCCFENMVPFVVLVADFPLITTDITDADGFTYPGVTRYVVAAAVRSKFIVPVHRKGRYVRVGLLREFTPLALGEVKVFEEPSAGTLRSTSSSAQSGTSVSKSAVDNSIDGNYVNGGVSVSPSTTATKLPYWDLTMDNDFPIESIDVYSTNTTCCSTVNPRPKFSLYASPSSTGFGTTPPTGALPTGVTRQQGLVQGAPTNVPVNRTVGRLRVQLEAADSLSLAEVKVWALATGSQGGYATISSKSSTSTEPFSGIDLSVAPAGDDITQKDVQTQYQTDPYYDIDLGGDRYIETINVWGQTDLSSSNLFSVWTSEFTKFPTSSPAYTAAKMRENQFTTGQIEWKAVGFAPVTTVSVGQRTRFIRIQVEGANQRLGLREVEIVTTEGYIKSLRNGANWDEDHVVPGTSGFHTRPNEPVDVYVFSPNLTTGSGFLNNWMYVNTGFSSSTPTTTPFSVAPVYPWSMNGIVVPAGFQPQGSVMGLYAQAYVNYATGISTPTPLRAINDQYSSINPTTSKNEADVFWPHVRLVGDKKSPDTNATPPAYLTKPMGTTVADTYYDKFQVGSGTGAYRELPDTLAQFNSRYLASRAVSANYYNVGDLGIGRKMTCAQPSWNAAGTTVYGTACAVANYAPLTTTTPKKPIFGDIGGTFNLMKNNAPPFATVVMVKRSGTAGSMFGVYIPSTNPPTTDTNKTKLVKTGVFLDSTGSNTTAPNNCMACHGGSAGSNPLDLTRPSMFLPFDPQAVENSRVVFVEQGWDWDHQEENFRKLNAMVVNVSAGPSEGIKDFVNGAYKGKVGTSGTKIDKNYIPAGWQKSAAQKDVFTKVIKPYCRGCHMSQSGALAFTNASDIEGLRGAVLNDVCKTHTMPHSQVTTKAAWKSSARAALLSYFGRDDLDATTMSLEACKP